MSTISIPSLILTSNITQLSSIGLFIPYIYCTLPKNHANVLYIDGAYARVRVPSKRHAHNNRFRLFRLLHTSAQYTGKVPSMVKNKGVQLSAHGRLPGTLRYASMKYWRNLIWQSQARPPNRQI